MPKNVEKIKKDIEVLPVPRHVHIRLKSVFSLQTLILLVILAIIVAVGWNNACMMISRYLGTAAIARVYDIKERTTNGGRNGAIYNNDLYISYPPPTYNYRGVVEIQRQKYLSLKKGDNLEIYYYDKFPTYPSVKGDNNYTQLYVSGILIILIFFYTCWVFVRERIFLEKGMPVKAEFLSEQYFSGGKGGGSTVWTVSYEWQGKKYTKHISVTGMNLDKENLLFLIMPDNPKSCILYDYNKYYLWDIDV